MALPPVLSLMGPTASGKTQLSLELASRLPVEIVSVDSAQVYRGMDIGTAKPSPGLRSAVPHHLIDILDPSQPYSAAQFAADAAALIAQIRARGRVPLLVGGTMLYFRALFDGLSELPPAAADLREKLAAEARIHGWPALHARLAAGDPDTAARLHPNDQQRIQRALEILDGTGIPPSRWYAQPRTGAVDGASVHVALVPDDRAHLHRRIDQRFDLMMDAGFLDEVRRLHARGDLRAELPAVRAVGYRQLWAHLDGACTLDEAIERGKAATRQYAKRQLTWLRGESRLLRFDPEASGVVDRILLAMKVAATAA
ncbi:tRNA (adenosine(37)-N6)-dimethylallyltransferase MiaA [Sinimarinibacterium flocculans]|uniref:tRNA dimethylallyltransferase n=1 Tax=Sinimarinibacterium flocculans TaxID=985250 RepID=A0A318ENM2_9GAMM|nr:tRNA (adenosine(37)-N6)-dimethylallyltransferase MiaA [Sinimarinibacterium flocculans]PXV71106.1 tRNA dimethylallyltransferase [Sinimarinibacterium flocculans]